MLTKVAAVFLLFSISAHAGFFDDVQGVTSDVGNFFSNQYQNAKDLFSNDQSELEKNVQRVKDLLTGLKEKVKGLEPIATDSQKAVLSKVDGFLQKVTNFQNEVKEEGSAKFNENKDKWQKLVNDIFEEGGLKSVLKFVGVENSASLVSISAAIIPIFYIILVR